MRTFAQKQNQPKKTAHVVRSHMATPALHHREHPLVHLQRMIGNQAVQRLLQTKTEDLYAKRDPNKPVSKPLDPLLKEELRKATRNPQPRPPEPTMPGDPIQQAHAVPRADPYELWLLPRIQERMKTIAAETEARERASIKPGGEVKHTAENLMKYWEQRFTASVKYILYDRQGDKRDKLLKKLRAEEEMLVKSVPAHPSTSSRSPDSAEEIFREKLRISTLIAQVEALRHSYKDKWQKEVDRAADQFVTLASNEAQFRTVNQAAKPVQIFGLPERLEGTVEASAHPVEVAKGAKPVAPSVVTFIKAVQKESGLSVKADNYTDHEKHSPYLGNIEGVGKYSFDVDLAGIIKVNAEGFYERDPLINFFLAVDRAATTTEIAWVALYNDFAVAKTVNEKLGKQRIGFSGGGREGSIHHGPAPYLLHIHFNIMPVALAGQFLAGKATPPRIDLGHWD